MNIYVSTVVFFTIIFQASGQKIQIKIDDIDLGLTQNSLINQSCFGYSKDLHFFSDKNLGFSLYTPPFKDIYSYNREENKSTIFKSELDSLTTIITVTEHPKVKYSIKELFLKEYLNISPHIGTKYESGIENINGNDVYWIKELIPHKEFKTYSILFYIYNDINNKIYLIDFTFFEEFNCKINGLILDILKSIQWI